MAETLLFSLHLHRFDQQVAPARPVLTSFTNLAIVLQYFKTFQSTYPSNLFPQNAPSNKCSYL